MTEINNYDTIADLYDAYVPTAFDVDFFLKETKRVGGEVLELMSGTGRVSVPLLKAGIRLTCVDLSAVSNAILKNKLRQLGLQADVYQMDVCELALQKQFDMIIIPFHSFAHITSPELQRRALDRIQQHLRPGGRFICTLRNPAVRQRDVDGQLRLACKCALPNGQGTLLLWIAEEKNEDDPQVVEAMQFYEEYSEGGILRSKRLLELHFRLSGRLEFEALARAAGFEVKSFYGDYCYSQFTEDSPFMIWILENVGRSGTV